MDNKHVVSSRVYEFLIDSYESFVEEFFNDPIGFIENKYDYSISDKNKLLREEFKMLNDIGEEIGIDMKALVAKEDLSYFYDILKEDEELDLEGEELEEEINIVNKFIKHEPTAMKIVGEWVSYNLPPQHQQAKKEKSNV